MQVVFTKHSWIWVHVHLEYVVSRSVCLSECFSVCMSITHEHNCIWKNWRSTRMQVVIKRRKQAALLYLSIAVLLGIIPWDHCWFVSGYLNRLMHLNTKKDTEDSNYVWKMSALYVTELNAGEATCNTSVLCVNSSTCEAGTCSE